MCGRTWGTCTPVPPGVTAPTGGVEGAEGLSSDAARSASCANGECFIPDPTDGRRDMGAEDSAAGGMFIARWSGELALVIGRKEGNGKAWS